jgi:regulator of sigma E protease
MVILNFLLAIVGFSLLIISHEFGHFISAKIFRIGVEEFAIGFGPRIVSFKFRGTLYSLRVIPFGGFNKLVGDEQAQRSEQPINSFLKKPASIRALTFLCGPIMNYLFAIILIFIFFIMGIQAPTTQVAEVIENSAADSAGFGVNDIIVSVGGTSVNSWEEIVAITQENPNNTLEYIVVRNSDHIKIFPMLSEMDGKGFLGISPKVERQYIGFVKSSINAVKTTGYINVLYVKGLSMLFMGRLSLEQARPVSPIGIVDMTAQVAQSGFQNFLFFMGLLSILLGMSNMIPLLPWDGGHLLMLLIERIRGRPLSEKTQKAIASFGYMIAIAIFAIAIFMDIFNPIDLNKFE